MATYYYSIAQDFPQGKIRPAIFEEEITAATGITTGVDFISTGVSTGGAIQRGTNPLDLEDRVEVAFSGALSSPELTVLDGDTNNPASGLIAVHATKPILLEHQDRHQKDVLQTTSTQWQSAFSVKSKKLVEGRYEVHFYCETSLLNGGLGDKVQSTFIVNGKNRSSTTNANTEWTAHNGVFYFDTDNGDRPDIEVEFRIIGDGGDTAQIRRIRLGWTNIGRKKKGDE
jgi:hypothetical protein